MQTMQEPKFEGPMATSRNSSQKGLETKVEHDPANFIIVPDTGVQISKGKIPSEESYNWKENHYFLDRSGLWMPRINVWMRHYIQVLEAKAGKHILLDGNRGEVVGDELDEVYQNVTNTLIHLDALFEDGSLKTNHRVINGDLIGTSQPLSKHLDENCFADLKSLNRQGLPIMVSEKQGFKLGKNIYFYKPVNQRVAGFGAGATRGDLYCNRNPAYTDARLWVFGCRDNKGE
jgi:hypothetical protein